MRQSNEALEGLTPWAIEEVVYCEHAHTTAREGRRAHG